MVRLSAGLSLSEVGGRRSGPLSRRSSAGRTENERLAVRPHCATETYLKRSRSVGVHGGARAGVIYEMSERRATGGAYQPENASDPVP
jgi:hypothetical protein